MIKYLALIPPIRHLLVIINSNHLLEPFDPSILYQQIIILPISNMF
jgi:hypothetical protein